MVVGPSRSGTAMLRACLNNHPGIALAGETHYFDDLRQRLGGSCADRLGAEASLEAERYFLALTHRPYGHHGDPDRGSIARADLRALAQSLGGTADDYFEAHCRLFAAAEHAVVWGEKTPRHVFRIPEIMASYPDARIIVAVRDPRAVVLSYRDWKNDQGGFDFERDPEHRDLVEDDNERARRSYHPVLLSLLWRGQMNAALGGVQRFGEDRVRLVRYEDVVTDFTPVMGALCDWLALPRDDAMARVPVLNSSFARFDPAGGVSRHSVDRWRTQLSAPEIAVVQWTCGSVAERLGYSPVATGTTIRQAAPLFGSLPFGALRAAIANHERVGRFGPYTSRRLRACIGAS